MVPSVKQKFTSNRRAFLRKHRQVPDMLAGHMAQDIEVIIKTGGRTPVDTGDMKAEVRHFKIRQGVFRVESAKEYSEVQEKGFRRGAARFRNYTTPGTGRGWFGAAVVQVARNADSYVDEVRRSLRI